MNIRNFKLNIRRFVLFLLVSGILMIFYTPHLRFNIKLNEVTDGTVIVSNFNTDRGEEIFTNYNYNSHKTWYDVHPGWEEVNITSIPIITNSLRLELDEVETLIAEKITVSFGTFVLKEYTADNLTQAITSSDGLDISLDNNLINLHTQNNKGYFQLETFEYFPHYAWAIVYGILLIISYLITIILDKHVSFIDKIPLNELMLLAMPCLIFFNSENILGNFYYIDLSHRLLNVGIMIVFYKLLYTICRRKPFSTLLANLTFTIFAIVSVFVVQFRNRPIAPWDFTALGTALDVASNYSWSFPYFMVLGIVLAIGLYVVMRFVPIDKTKINRYYFAYPIIILVVALFFNSVGSYYLWDMNLLSIYQTDGTPLTFTGLFAQYIKDSPSQPSNYSIDTLNEISAQMNKDAKADVKSDEIVPDTIIQIMNESFCNLNIGGTDYASNITPFFDSLDNTIRGNLYVSVRGGGTCNSEYETLTGNTTAFFSSGVYPYNMYMSRNVPSLVSYFNDEGYTTSGIHLGKSTNWNRASAYKKLKFQNTEFAETFDGLQTVHGYPSDEEDFNHVISQFEKNPEGKNYIFNVTYQNHGGFDNADDLVKTVDLSSYGPNDYSKAENYLSLLRLTDQSFEKLIEYFSNVDKHVMIVMYGDHQPSLGADADNLFFPNSGNSTEEMLKEYITPFVIWANYDIPDAYIEKMSSNYLSSLILKTANLELTPYQQYLYELMQEYPVLGPYGCYDKDGNFYESINDINDPLVKNYECLQYNNVFDKNRQTSIFWQNN